jgi:predicted TIM-barrel fold metal-dependent hydrolase
MRPVWPILPFDRNIQEIRELAVKTEVRDKWLGGNVADCLILRACKIISAERTYA